MAESKSPLNNMNDNDLQRFMRAYINELFGIGATPNINGNPAQKDNVESSKRMARAIRNEFDAFIEVGFNEYEALDLVKIFLEKSLK